MIHASHLFLVGDPPFFSPSYVFRIISFFFLGKLVTEYRVSFLYSEDSSDPTNADRNITKYASRTKKTPRGFFSEEEKMCIFYHLEQRAPWQKKEKDGGERDYRMRGGRE